jgi:hypothetical protein
VMALLAIPVMAMVPVGRPAAPSPGTPGEGRGEGFSQPA